ncbi:MAG: FtsX-like permease family protein [Pseudomonadota bacterium]
MALPFLSREFLHILGTGQGGRGLLSVAAIALGVALGYAIHLIHAVAVYEMEQAARSLTGEADLVVQSLQGGMDESWYPVVARRPEVAVASPVLELEAKVPGRTEKLKLLGMDVFRADALQPAFFLGGTGDALDRLRPDRIFLNPASAAWLDAREGGEVILQSGLSLVKLRVAGTVNIPGPPVAAMDIAGAQAQFGQLGRITRIDLRLVPGIAAQRAAQSLQSVLPEGIRVEVPEARAAQAAGFSRAYRVNLNVLALVALFAGGLLVFSSQALAVVRRRSQWALLRALGVRRNELAWLLVMQAAAVGALGGVLGVMLGYWLAQAALDLFGPDLGAAFFRGIAPQLAVAPGAAVFFALLGAAAAALGSLSPALEAARAAPARALHAGDDERAFARFGSPRAGAALIVLGGVAAWLPPVAGLPVFGYIAVALLLIGAIVLLPWLSRAVFALLPMPGAPLAGLSFAQLRAAPSRASLSLAPLVASIAVAAAMAVMVSSFRYSLEAWLDRVLPADLYVRAGGGGDTAYFTTDAERLLRGMAGVERVEFARSVAVSLSPGRPPVMLLARQLDPAAPGARLPLIGESLRPGAGQLPLWVSEVAADLYGWGVGGTIRLPIGGRMVEGVVAGIWRDYARSQGAIVMEREAYRNLSGDERANEAALWLRPGTDPGAVARALAAAFPAGALETALPGELRRISLAVFDRTFAATYVLEGAAIAVGLAGLSASFAAQVAARRREFGMLRHLGVTRRQIGFMLACQGALLALVALIVGLVLGSVISLILIYVINRQSFHWSMDPAVPWAALAAFALATVVLAAATAWVSGRQAMRREAVLAVKEDW